MDARMRVGVLAMLALAGLVACSRGAPATSAPAVQAPVNPDAGVTTYACKDGSSVVAGYPDAQTAVVTWKDHAYTLKRAGSANGQRYTGYGLQWWLRGGYATLKLLRPGEDEASGPSLDCVPQPDKGAARI